MSNERMMISGTGASLAPATSTTRMEARREQATPVQSAAQPEAKSQQRAVPSDEKIEAVAERLEAYLRSVSRSLQFRVDSSSGRTVVSVLDSETGDLIRQIPSEEVLRFAEMAEDQTIVLLNESA